MKIKDIEKAMYEDEEFLKYLPLLKEEYWAKATPNKRLKFFEELQRIIHDLEPRLPRRVLGVEFGGSEDKNIYVSEEDILVNDALFKKKLNPYDVISNYVFELAIVNNFLLLEDKRFLRTEKGKKMAINRQESVLGEWDNYLARTNKEFYYQPIIRDCSKSTRKFLYNLISYMHEKYGMDKYIGAKLSSLMLASFEDEKDDIRTENNYKIMEKRSEGYETEKKKLDDFFDYMNEVDFDSISDEEFYAFFEDRVMDVCDGGTIYYLFEKFIERNLKGFDGLEDVLAEFAVGEYPEYGKCIVMGNRAIVVKSYKEAFYNLVIYISNIKLREGLCTEIEDKEFLCNAKECYEYILALQEDDGSVECEYLGNAFSYYEYRNKMLDYYYNTIQSAIKKSKFYNDGVPYLYKGDFSKYEAYLNFAFDLDYEQAKKAQFDSLKKRYTDKLGGKR